MADEKPKTKKELEVDELKELQEGNKVLIENIKKEKEELKGLMEARENQKAEDLVSGKSEAGTERKAESEEEKVKRESNEYLKGTGLEI